MRFLLTLAFTCIIFAGLQAQCTISFTPTNPCPGETVTFSIDNPTYGVIYSWDFDGDGNADDTGTSVGYSFPFNNTAQSYPIEAFADGTSCDQTTINVLASPEVAVNALGTGVNQSGNSITACTGSPDVSFELFNTSPSPGSNSSYEVNWGDGSPVENYTNATWGGAITISHDFSGFGFFPITITTTHNNGCTRTQTFSFYNGSNPSVGLANPGNTVGLCAPATLDFPITNTANNPPGTTYEIFLNDMLIATYDQNNIPAIFTYTFDESSCGETTSNGQYENSFELSITASNPCNSSSATIQPIQLSSSPEPGINVIEPANNCPGEVFTFQDVSTNINEVGNQTCENELTQFWSITPGTDGNEWTLLSGTFVGSEELDVQFDVPGTYTVTLTLNSAACGQVMISETVTITTPPLADAITDYDPIADECAPSTINFTNLSSGPQLSFTWQVDQPNGWQFTGGTDENSENPSIQFTQPGTYAVSLTTSNVCDNDLWDTTFVFAGPPSATIDPLGNFCETAAITLDANNVSYSENGSPISNYSWTFSGGTPSSSTQEFPGTINYNSVGNYTIELTVENGCGPTTVSTNFSVIAPPVLTLPLNTTVCEDEPPFPLIADPPGGTWSGPGITNDSIFNPNQADIGLNTLSYQFDAGECSVDGTLEITVNPLPAIDPGVDLAACPTDAPIPLTASPAGGTWSSPDGGVITNDEFDPVASGVGTYTLLYTYTDTENCTNSASIMATVHPLPQVVANDTTYCNTPGLVDLPFASPVGGTWSGPGLSGGQFDPNATGTGTFDLTYVFTNANNCTDSTQIQVTVSDPDQVSAGPDTSFCASVTNVDLTPFANPAGGTWSLQGGGPGLNGNTFDPSTAGDGTYTLLYSIGSGNCEVTASFQITVFGLASVNLSANPTELCVSEPAITLQALPTGGTWTGTGISGDQFDPMVAQDGTFPLLYNYTDANGCDASNTLDLTVHPLPQLSVGDTTYCNTPGTVNLPFTAPAGGIWEGPGVAGDQFDPNGAGGVNDYTLQYTFTDGNGCTDSIDISVMVIEPVAVEAGPGDTVCIDQGLIQLTGFNPAGGTWSGPGIVDPTAGTFNPQIAGGGPITLSYSLGTGNCEVVDQTTVEVIDVTSVDPGPGAELCLLDDPITLTGASPSGGVWSGLGITDPIAGTFDPQLTGDTTVTITYTYTEQFSGCAASATTTVTVHPMPESDFTLPAEACIDQDILFTNTSADTFESAWTFGDGGSSMATDPTYQYTLPGTYTVTLISTTQEGCTDSASLDLFITEPPVAAFTTDTDEGCSVLEVNTSNSSSGYDISYFWDLGNGDTTSLVDPGTIFYEQGINDTTYILTLAVSNLCATVEAVDTITVYPLPQVNFGTNVDTGCTPLSIQFANLTMGNPETFFWDLGNGITSTDSIPPNQIYYTDTVPTTYPVTLIATNFCGTDTLTQEVTVNPVDVEAFFNVPVTTGCQPLTLPFTSFATPGAFVEWDFGDGNTAANPNPVHTFTEAGTFEVVQYVTNGCGYDSTTVNITVLPAPELSFEHVPFVCLGDTIQFNNTSLDPLAGTIWDFGDGDSSVLNNPLHTYEQEGTYTVQLTGISSQNGCPATISSEVLVVGLPTADFSAPTFNGCTPFTITFDNNSSGGDFYTWNFGDGNTSTDETPTHTYLQEDTYTVSLIVSDDFGCSSDTAVLNVTSHPVPVAGFSYDADQACGVPVTINFENLSQGAQGYNWDFGQGTTSTLVSPAQVYVDTGQFVVQLIASNQFGCQDTSEQTLRTLPAPTADFDWDPLLGCNPQRVQLFNNSQLANGFTWFFTDGGSAGDTATAYVFQEPGNYGITLIADYDGLCFDTLEIPNAVEILPSPFANFDWSEITDPELSGSFNFTDASEFALSWQWDFGDGTISEETNPFHRFFSNGPQQVTLTVTGANGCTDDTLQIITPGFFKGLHLPNALSPEYGPEETRVFQPKGAGLQTYHLQIFSSYGELIWETRLLQDGQPVEAWDGTFRGNLLPPDVYVWKASATFLDGSVWEGVSDGNGGFKKVGSVLLIR